MNDVFNTNRLGLLIKKDIQENGRGYLVRSFVICGILAFLYVFMHYSFSHIMQNDFSSAEFAGTFISKNLIRVTFVVFLLSLLIFASSMMEPIKSKQKRTHFLTLPSSSLEKYLSRFLICSVGFLLVFVLSALFADAIRVGFYSLIYQGNVPFIEWKQLLDNPSGEFWFSVSLIVLTLSFYMLGTTFWQRNSFSKTTGAFLLLHTFFGAVVFFSFWLCSLFYDDFFTKLAYVNGINITKESSMLWVTVCVFILAAFNWVLSYFRFKEAEIIERW